MKLQREGINFEFNTSFPTLVDPTRRMLPENCRIFSREEIQMHHFSYVRNDIRKKLENSTSIKDYENNIDKIIYHFENYNYPENALWCNLKEYKINKVENIFNIWN